MSNAVEFESWSLRVDRQVQTADGPAEVELTVQQNNRRTNRELNLDDHTFAVDRVDQLILIDVTMRFTKKSKRQSVEHRRFTCAILTNNKGRSRTVQRYLSKNITG